MDATAGNSHIDQVKDEEMAAECHRGGVGTDSNGGGELATCQYHVLSKSSIFDLMRTRLQEVNSIVQLPALTVLRLLLNYFKWDKDRFIEVYFDKTPAELSRMTGIDMKLNKNPILQYQRGTEREKCGICLRKPEELKLLGLSCQHFFCQPCWTQYAESQIMDVGHASEALRCPAFACNLLLDDDAVVDLIKNSHGEIKARFQRMITNRFVNTNRALKWCPKPKCGNVIQIKDIYGIPSSVTCDCSMKFCFECSEEAHEPVKCDLLAKWKAKMGSEWANTAWLNNHTKGCPHCKVAIEKTGGCNEVSCTCCGYRFCWICRKPWSTHTSGFLCNSYAEAPATHGDLNVSQTAAVRRFVHFYNCYSAHGASLKLEAMLTDIFKEKVEQCMREFQHSWLEAQFVLPGIDVLRSSRQILQNTYVFAYFLKKNNQQEIFQVNQADLQQAIEDLSYHLQTHLVKGSSIVLVKQEILDLARYCSARCEALVDHIKDGFEKDWWEFSS